MPKSKEFVESSDESSGSASEEEVKPKKRKIKRESPPKKEKKSSKGESSDESSGSASEEEFKPKKKKVKRESPPKKEKKSSKKEKSSKGESSSSMTGENGETMYQLAKMRYASVSEFRGKKYVNLREYYFNGDGDMKPGRKGMALNQEQWASLKEHMDALDEDLND